MKYGVRGAAKPMKPRIAGIPQTDSQGAAMGSTHTLSAYTSDQLARYLDYIEFPAALRPSSTPRDYCFLHTLHKHQISRIPYENLSLHYNPEHANSLDPQILYNKFTNHRGGYCMEQTIFFRHILRALGFRVYTAGARVRLRKNNVPQGPYIGW